MHSFFVGCNDPILAHGGVCDVGSLDDYQPLIRCTCQGSKRKNGRRVSSSPTYAANIVGFVLFFCFFMQPHTERESHNHPNIDQQGSKQTV